MPMLQKKAQFGSGVFASRNALVNVPKSAHDTLFFTATSWDMDGKVKTEAEHDENMNNVYEIGRHNCKYLPHPGNKVPLLTHHSCSTFSTFDRKPAADFELNCSTLKSMKEAAGGASGPKVSMNIGSKYAETYGRGVSPERRRRAKPPLMSWDAGTGFKGDVLAKSHTQTTHGAHASSMNENLARTTKWDPANNIEITERCSDFWRSRASVAHSASSVGVAPPPTKLPSRSSRKRDGHHGKVEAFLEEYRKDLDRRVELANSHPSVQRSASAPDMIVPITFVGGRMH